MYARVFSQYDQFLVARTKSCTNRRQVSWLADHHAPVRLPGLPVTPIMIGVTVAFPAYSDEIAQVLHLFPF